LQVERRNNNFDCLRLFAALIVLYSHCYALFGLPEPVIFEVNDFHRKITLGTLGVTIFFVTSGFLITGSYSNNKGSIKNYALSRVLRIYPALIVQYLLILLVVGMLASDLTPDAYYHYLQTNIVLFIYCIVFSVFTPWMFLFSHNFITSLVYMFPPLPGVFVHNPKGIVINGNLWTLFYESSMYIAIPLIFKLRGLLKINILLLSVILYAALLFWYDGFNPHSLAELGLLHCWSFLLGSLIYQYREKLPHNILILLAGVIALIACHNSAYELFPLCRLHKYGDFSYGIYLYAYPIQQYFYTLYPNNFPLYALMSTATTFVLAVLSWRFIEAPALRYKPVKSA
jgi:peptidoglycan/LPS O-acetylase OafA/YrhL